MMYPLHPPPKGWQIQTTHDKGEKNVAIIIHMNEGKKKDSKAFRSMLRYLPALWARKGFPGLPTAVLKCHCSGDQQTITLGWGDSSERNGSPSTSERHWWILCLQEVTAVNARAVGKWMQPTNTVSKWLWSGDQQTITSKAVHKWTPHRHYDRMIKQKTCLSANCTHRLAQSISTMAVRIYTATAISKPKSRSKPLDDLGNSQ